MNQNQEAPHEANARQERMVAQSREADKQIIKQQNPRGDFGYALDLMKRGLRASRASWWQGYIVIKPGYPAGIEANLATRIAHSLPEGSVIKYDPYIEMALDGGRFCPYTPSQGDLLAFDWQEYRGVAPSQPKISNQLSIFDNE